MSNKWNNLLEAESISKCNQRLPFSSTPRKKVLSFGRRSSHRNCLWVIFVFKTMYNVWGDWGEFSLNISQPPNRNLFDVLQAKRIESFYAHHNILTQRILHGGIVERFLTNWNVESVHLKQLKWFPIHDEVNRTDQRFSEILLCLIYGHLGGH